MPCMKLWSWGRFGLSYIGFRQYGRPSWERFDGGYWYVQAFGLTFWYDPTRPRTVGERGVW